MSSKKVYLAGGTHTNWRDEVKKECGSFEYIDPKEKEKNGEWELKEYGTWDLHYIEKCDIFFGYMEKTNPSGIGLAVEIGFAHGLCKTAILALERDNQHTEDRYLKFMEKGADVVYEDIESAKEFLKTFQ